MSSETDSDEAAQWKRKYFDQLSASESQEKQWRDADELLRKTIARLSLAAEGQDSKLDKQLRALRTAIRDRASGAELKAAIDAMSKAIVRLDQRHEPDLSTHTGGELLQLLDRLRLPRACTPQLTALRKQLSGCGDAVPLEGFASLIRTALKHSTSDAPAGSRPGLLQRFLSRSAASGSVELPAEGAHASARDILIQLLERLSLPDELSERVADLHGRIAASKDDSSWDESVEEIADLIQLIRSRTQKELQGIENFLAHLGGQLHAVDCQLVGSEQYYDDSYAAGETLDSAMKQGLDGIESGMREASDLDQMKQLVQVQLDSVKSHLETHRASEEQRYATAKEEIRVTNDRLLELEAESDRLRSRIRDQRSQALSDALTGIPNRLAWEEQVEQEVARRKRIATPLVLLIWDVDRFKAVNDRFGHNSGDKVLRTIARSLADSIRETDFIARYGGEEFAHLMIGSELADCLVVADRLRESIQATGFHFRDKAVTITVSCGLAQFRDGDSVESWFERADRALYRAKGAGRNRCEPEDPAESA